MKRQCFLCATEVEVFSSKNWKISGIGIRKIEFGICASCGTVIQSTTPSIEDINNYYKEAATYINPGRAGKPSLEKVKGLDRLGYLIKDKFGYMPKTVFQVGCSDGYTLHRMKGFGADEVKGIDLSQASCDMARDQYRIDVIRGDFESYDFGDQKFELLILTHVLEHLFEPVSVLKKCNKLQEEQGKLVIEVPLLENPDRFPPGIFTLEHLNYFSEFSICDTIQRSGYLIEMVVKDFSVCEYPVITLFCVKGTEYTGQYTDKMNYKYNRDLINQYMDSEKKSYQKIENRIHESVRKGGRAYIYGAGIHTSQLFANTDIEEYLEIISILDSSPTKWGRKIGEYPCINPEDAHDEVDAVIISSHSSEDEIYASIIDHYDHASVIRLYG